MSDLQDDMARLREAWEDLWYSVCSALGIDRLARRLGMKPRAWFREAEIRAKWRSKA